MKIVSIHVDDSLISNSSLLEFQMASFSVAVQSSVVGLLSAIFDNQSEYNYNN